MSKLTYVKDINLMFKNSTKKQYQCKFSFKTPEIMKENLNDKKIRIQKLRINNTFIPLFIPDRYKTQDELIEQDTELSLMGLIKNYSQPNTLYIRSPNVPTVQPNLLKYFTCITTPTTIDISILQPTIINKNIPIPNYVIKNDIEYYTNQGYYYYDLGLFLKQLQIQINGSLNMFYTTSNVSYCKLQYTQTGNGTSVSIFLQNSMFVAPNDMQILGFSRDLLEILPFSNIYKAFSIIESDLISYIDFTEETIQMNGVAYRTASCTLFDNMFPFTQLLINSDLMNVNPEDFIDNNTLSSNISTGNPTSTMLSYDISTENPLGIYNYYTYINNYDSEWKNFLNATNSNGNVDIYIGLRMRNFAVIPMTLNPNELLQITIQIKHDMLKIA